MLHLRVVLVPMETSSQVFPDKSRKKAFKAHPKGFVDVVMDIHWDSIENRDAAAADAASAAGHPIDHRSLVCNYDPEDWVPACGILLRSRPLDDQ